MCSIFFNAKNVVHYWPNCFLLAIGGGITQTMGTLEWQGDRVLTSCRVNQIADLAGHHPHHLFDLAISCLWKCVNKCGN